MEYSLDELLRTLLNAPLFEKPEIGTSPFKPMAESRPDRTSDGLKELMKAVAKAYENEAGEYVFYSEVIESSPMHRLSFDGYLKAAIEMDFLDWSPYEDGTLKILEAGVLYLQAHSIIPS